MTHKTAAELGAKLSEILESVDTTGEPVAIESAGRTVAVLSAGADAARAEPDESVSWEQIKADLGW